jgi:outer membrane protein assembly factor BamD
MFNFNTLRQLSIFTVLSLTLVGCTSSPEEDIERVPDNSPKARYVEAKKSLNNGMYNRAIAALSDLENRYPFGPLSRQVQLDLIFAYYKSGRFAEALPSIDRFINLNPNHTQLDYALYMRGLVNMEMGINSFQDFFGVENADKDMLTSRDAFSDFNKVVNNYPNSKYIPDAKKRMIALLDKLARHEVVIAKYYMRRSAYAAALNRCKYILEYYQQSSSVKDALTIMVSAYDNLGLPEMKADAELALKQNQ